MKRIIGVITLVSIAMALVACAGSGDKEQQANQSPEKTIAATIEDKNIYLDEAQYYLYTTQATYEVYYMAQNKEINWKKKHGKSTLEDLAKGAALDKICKITCFAQLKKEYNIEIDAQAKEEIKKKADTYYTGSDENLKAKINIKKARLMKLFEREYIAETVEDIMNTTEDKSADKYYSKWLSNADVECMSCWNNIKFSTNIFSKDKLNQNETATEGDEYEDNGHINVNENEQQ